MPHHSLARFDTQNPLWVKGTIVRFDRVNPHSVIYLDQEREDGRVHRWAVHGPAIPGLAAMGVAQHSLKPGDVLEVCGFATEVGAAAQNTSTAATSDGAGANGLSLRGQVMNGHLLVLEGGRKRFWSDYGLLRRCISDEERATLSRDWREPARQ